MLCSWIYKKIFFTKSSLFESQTVQLYLTPLLSGMHQVLLIPSPTPYSPPPKKMTYKRGNLPETESVDFSCSKLLGI